jgi:hypothetical protein
VYGACFASFASADDPDVVLAFYRAELESAGYTVDMAPRAPIFDEANAVIGETVGLSATDGSFGVTISGEIMTNGRGGYSILGDDAQPAC